MQSIIEQINDSIETKKRILTDNLLISKIEAACELVLKTYDNNNKTILAGNGGSAADAQHIAAEFVSRFNFDRPGIPSLALTTDTSIITAIGNDYGYEKLFARQLEAQSLKGDLFIGITTSGGSKNIIEALRKCQELGIFSIVLTGNDCSEISELSDLIISVPSNHTPRIQESHILIGHIICCYVEEKKFGKLKD